jgi:hypothetical protein
MPKASQQPGEPEEIPCEDSGRDPPGDGACSESRWPEHLKACMRHRAAILSDIIINENLKLLQINYLA